jgi:hypothetical protein
MEFSGTNIAEYRWLGSSSRNFNIEQGMNFYIFDSTNLDSLRMYHDGTDFNFNLAGTTDVNFAPSGVTSVNIHKSTSSFGTAGHSFVGNSLSITRTSNPMLNLNLLGSDGKLVRFYHASTEEGDISSSGTTIQYNGAHLSFKTHNSTRTREVILRGTVMEYDTDKAEWWIELDEETGFTHKRKENKDKKGKKNVLPKKDNEQVMVAKVSDTAGAKTVAGVFSGWDDDEEEDTDFYVATTGDFIIRVTGPCAQGDLLESNGDGTARVQADDIVRSSTIAKAVQAFPGIAAGVENPELVPCQLLNG